MRKIAICLMCVLTISLVSCNNSEPVMDSSSTSSQNTQLENSNNELNNDFNTSNSDSSYIENNSTLDLETSSDQEMGGTNAKRCMEHSLSYHSIDVSLMNYVGQEEAVEWAETTNRETTDEYRRGEGVTIQAFIEKFNIPKDVFTELTQGTISQEFAESLGMTLEECYEEYGYTDEQIDALYSGDQDAIDRAFCGPLAFVNEADQKVYSIYWLMDHTAEDYAAAQLSLNQVEEVLQTASEEEYGERYDLIEKVEPKLTQAYALEEAALAETEPSAGIAVPEGAATESIPSEIEESSETAETGTESSAVVQDETVGSNPAE